MSCQKLLKLELGMKLTGIILITVLFVGCSTLAPVSMSEASVTTSTPVIPTTIPALELPTSTLTLAPPTVTPTDVRPTDTPTPEPWSLVVGDWETLIAFNVGDQVCILEFSFTVNEDGNQITGYGIGDLCLATATGGTTSAVIVDRTFTINADTYMGTTKIGRKFEGTFVEPDKVEGVYRFDYARFGVHEGEWVGNPKPEE